MDDHPFFHSGDGSTLNVAQHLLPIAPIPHDNADEDEGGDSEYSLFGSTAYCPGEGDAHPCHGDSSLFCEHHHEVSKGPDGKDVVECVHTHKRRCSDGKTKTQSNRIAVQKYRAKKKAEMESLQDENRALRAEVEQLRADLKLKGSPLTAGEREELEMLRNKVKQISSILTA